LLPGTGLVELAARAGDQVGAERVEELTLSAPLVLPEHGSVQLQLTVGPDDGSGYRSIEIHSRVEGDEYSEGVAAPPPSQARPWAVNATGTLVAAGSESGETLAVWPPAGAVEVPLDGVYDRLADQDYT
uniref:polyketide synthase dehydratase domain-containing protein n=1 Tax=Streptomyces apocyni TaxID=2654677 RepID=UPI0012E9960C